LVEAKVPEPTLFSRSQRTPAVTFTAGNTSMIFVGKKRIAFQRLAETPGRCASANGIKRTHEHCLRWKHPLKVGSEGGAERDSGTLVGVLVEIEAARQPVETSDNAFQGRLKREKPVVRILEIQAGEIDVYEIIVLFPVRFEVPVGRNCGPGNSAQAYFCLRG